jgi:rhodanese-related sulfurtransferase
VIEGIPGAVSISLEEPIDPWVAQLSDVDMVFYCACPNELSAALLAEKLRARGLTRGKALVGGLDAWRTAQAQQDAPAQAATA